MGDEKKTEVADQPKFSNEDSVFYQHYQALLKKHVGTGVVTQKQVDEIDGFEQYYIGDKALDPEVVRGVELMMTRKAARFIIDGKYNGDEAKFLADLQDNKEIVLDADSNKTQKAGDLLKGVTLKYLPVMLREARETKASAYNIALTSQILANEFDKLPEEIVKQVKVFVNKNDEKPKQEGAALENDNKKPKNEEPKGAALEGVEESLLVAALEAGSAGRAAISMVIGEPSYISPTGRPTAGKATTMVS